MARVAGTSALVMYRSVRRRRRRRLALGTALVGAALAAAVMALSPDLVLVAGAAGLLVLLTGLIGPSGRDVDRWRRGAEGELRTAELLRALPSRRWSVWHDLRVPRSRANIDHLVVGRTGIWVVDTKTTRSEVRAGWRSVRFGDRLLDTGTTRWEADVVSAELAARLGEEVPDERVLRRVVRPIVAMHGRGLRPRGSRVGGVRVVPAEMLVERITRGRRRLRRGQRKAVEAALVDAFGPAAVGRRTVAGGQPAGRREVAGGQAAAGCRRVRGRRAVGSGLEAR